MSTEVRQKIPVPRRSFLWSLNETSGEILMHVGPTEFTPSANDRIVRSIERGPVAAGRQAVGHDSLGLRRSDEDLGAALGDLLGCGGADERFGRRVGVEHAKQPGAEPSSHGSSGCREQRTAKDTQVCEDAASDSRWRVGVGHGGRLPTQPGHFKARSTSRPPPCLTSRPGA
jgi:hypothetical protein